MKTTKPILIILTLTIFLIFETGCKVYQTHHHSKGTVHYNGNGNIPPGQMKKMTGEKSAKKYAPGQQKKHDNGK